jgi:hypothetical protein
MPEDTMKINKGTLPDVINWLIEDNPWSEYRVRLDLLSEDPQSVEVSQSRLVMRDDPHLKPLLQELSDWPGEVMKNHKSAGHPIHKLAFIADVGFQLSDPPIADIVERITGHRDPVGPFQVLMNVHPRYGGSGEDEWAWALCDAPLLIYSLAKFGLADDQRLIDAAAYLAGLVRENGWPCAVSKEMGKFRGPGRKDDPCPYANLVMLKALDQFTELRDSPAVRSGVENLLNLWETRRERHPYLFYMGTDFCKLKAPLIWYDILHVSDVLSQFPWVREDPRFLEMAAIIDRKSDTQGRFTPESIWAAWKGWDFGQKKVPSPWLTFLVHRMRRRLI